MNIPSRFREVLREVYATDSLKVTPWKDCLRVYPLPEWQDLLRLLMTEGKKQRHASRFVRYLVGRASDCPLDKQGRILLPPKLRQHAGIGERVVAVGMLSHFEIWDQEAWRLECEQSQLSFHEFESVLADLGIL